MFCAIALPFVLVFDGFYLGCKYHEAFVTRKKDNLSFWKAYRKSQKKRAKWVRCILYFSGVFLLWHFLTYFITAYVVFALKHTILWLYLWGKRIVLGIAVVLLMVLFRLCEKAVLLWEFISARAKLVYNKI